MKSAIFTYQKSETTIDFPGRIALLLFTKGCNFRCRYCHNPELIPIEDTQNMSYAELDSLLNRAQQNWIDGICITGGEPTMQPQLPQTAAFIKQHGMAVKIDTQGSFPKILAETLPFCDFVAMDYKMPSQRYADLTQTPVNMDAIRQSLQLLQQSGVDYEIRTTVVPGIHTQQDIETICHELQGVSTWVLQTFIPRDNLPDEALHQAQRTSLQLLEQFAAYGQNFFDQVIVR